MDVRGEQLIGDAAVAGQGAAFRGFDPALRAPLEPAFAGATPDDIERACALADAAADPFRNSPPEERARFLEAIALRLTENGPALVDRAMAESGLPRVRLEGELGRTANQLRLFARVVREGGYLDVRIDRALPDRTPPRPDLRVTYRALGPVVVFGASNFPLAFSVAGGDTASALAAGCPVIVKAHPAHPGTSELAGRAVQQAVRDCGLPEGVFSLLFDSGVEIGSALVGDRRIQAVGFTGSRRGGLALIAIAQARPQPIPVYAEMSAVNPVLLLPGALGERGAAIGRAFAGALTLGSGQFCTNPGMVIVLEGSDIDSFVSGAGGALAEIAPATMLTQGIYEAYVRGTTALDGNARVARVAEGPAADGFVSRPALFATTADYLLADDSLREEVFGAASVLVRCKDIAQLRAVIDDLEGQLTAAVHANDADMDLARDILPGLERAAGRILFNGFGTGVEVCDAMVHGGPSPATSDVRTTSVGSLAIMRFVRPVCYQNVPSALLPPEVSDANPWGVPQRIDGVRDASSAS